MAFSWEVRGGTHKQLTWNELAGELQEEQAERSTADITRILRNLLERYEETEFIKYLVAPSPSSLALYFQIPLEQVYQALKDLELQGFQTESSSHYAPIILWDPLIREKTYRFIGNDGSVNFPPFES